ncbi:MAG: ThuA domain-containing protein [Verrucomicrobiota bacterium]
MKKLFTSAQRITSALPCATLILFSVILLVAGSAEAESPKKILVVTVTTGFPHSSVPTAEKVLASLGEKSGAFKVVDIVGSGPRPKEKAEETAWMEKLTHDLAGKMSPASLKNYDGIIFANTTGDLPLPDKTAFLQWIAAGHAFIGMHSATDTFRGHTPLDPYVEMIGAEFKTHGAQVEVTCINQDPKHPACRNFGPTFTVTDEIYIMNGFDRAQVHGLLGLEKHPNSGEAGDYPVAWCKNFSKGKVFYTSLGHREDVWESAAYQNHILGGIKWALGLEKGSAKPQTKSK